MRIVEGSAFYFNNGDPGGTTYRHMWIIISDPIKFPDNVLIVNMTTQRTTIEIECELHPGDHPDVEHPSYIIFSKARVYSVEKLTEDILLGFISPTSSVDLALLERIRAVDGQSIFIARSHKKLLMSQDLI